MVKESKTGKQKKASIRFENSGAGLEYQKETVIEKPKNQDTAGTKKEEVKKLWKNGKGLNKSEIARKLKISRASVINFLK